VAKQRGQRLDEPCGRQGQQQYAHHDRASANSIRTQALRDRDSCHGLQRLHRDRHSIVHPSCYVREPEHQQQRSRVEAIMDDERRHNRHHDADIAQPSAKFLQIKSRAEANSSEPWVMRRQPVVKPRTDARRCNHQACSC